MERSNLLMADCFRHNEGHPENAGFGVALGSLSFNVQCCAPVFLENKHGVSYTGICWLLGEAWFLCRYGDFWVSPCLLMFPGVRSSLMF